MKLADVGEKKVNIINVLAVLCTICCIGMAVIIFATSQRQEESSSGEAEQVMQSEMQEYGEIAGEAFLLCEDTEASLLEPADLYEMIVVIDLLGENTIPGHISGGDSEDEILIRVAKQLQKRIAESNIKLYFTRSENKEESDKNSATYINLIEKTGADLFLQIGISHSGEKDVYGIQTFYNEEYYFPGFGNVEWADIVTREVTTSTVNKALGLFPAEDDSILRELEIPGARIHIGFATNEQEHTLLQQESYQEKIAQGIAEAITEVYTDKMN